MRKLKPILNMEKFQAGGQITLNAPVEYRHTFTPQINLDAIQKQATKGRTKKATPAIDTSKLKPAGYSIDNIAYFKQVRELSNKLNNLSEEDRLVLGPQLTNQLAVLTSPENLYQLQRIKEEGDAGLATLKANKGESQTLTQSGGKILLRDNKTDKFFWLNPFEAYKAKEADKGRFEEVTGAAANTYRDESQGLLGDYSVVRAYGSTVGINKIIDDLKRFETSARDKKQWASQKVIDLGNRTKGIVGDSLTGAIGIEARKGSTEDNLKQYALGFKSAYQSLSSDAKNSLKTHVSEKLANGTLGEILTEKDLQAAGLNAATLKEDAFNDERVFDTIVEMGSLALVRDYLYRKRFRNTSSEQKVSFNKGLSSFGGGAADYKGKISDFVLASEDKAQKVGFNVKTASGTGYNTVANLVRATQDDIDPNTGKVRMKTVQASVLKDVTIPGTMSAGGHKLTRGQQTAFSTFAYPKLGDDYKVVRLPILDGVEVDPNSKHAKDIFTYFDDTADTDDKVRARNTLLKEYGDLGRLDIADFVSYDAFIEVQPEYYFGTKDEHEAHERYIKQLQEAGVGRKAEEEEVNQFNSNLHEDADKAKLGDSYVVPIRQRLRSTLDLNVLAGHARTTQAAVSDVHGRRDSAHHLNIGGFDPRAGTEAGFTER